MENILRVLEHLSYVIESGFNNYMSEAKYELWKLVASLRTDERYRIDGGEVIANRLEVALEKLKSRGGEGGGPGELSSVSRELWGRVVDKQGNLINPPAGRPQQ